jgi:integrase
MRGSVKRDGATWMFVVDLPRGVNGARRQQKRRGYPTRKSAEAELQKALQRASAGMFIEPSKMTLDSYLVDQWLPAIEGTVRSSTLASYKGNITRHVVPMLGSVRLQALTAPMLTVVYRKLGDDKALSPKTIRHVHTTIRKALSDAMKWGLVERNAASTAEPPKLVRSEMKTWNAGEVRAFLRYVEDDPMKVVFTLLCTTGMRRGEVLGLRWSDVDFDNARLRVQQTLTSVEYQLVFGEPKTARGRRSVPIDPTTLSVLRQHRARQNETRLMMGSAWTNAGDLVMVKPDGSPIHPDTVSDTFDRRVKASGLRKIRLHDLRHTWATLALEANVPVKVVSEVLGHNSPAFTLDVYSHVTPVMMEDLARSIGATIFGNGA